MSLPFVVAVVDANILVPNLLRDVFVSLAFERGYAARWSNHIHDEWMRNVIKLRPDIKPSAMENVRDMMNRHVKDSLVADYEPLIETLHLPDPNDRHVLAAAIVAKADVIVTNNIRDFPVSALAPHNVRAQKPDAFLCDLWRDNAPEMVAALAVQRARLRNPPQTPAEFTQSLARQGLTRFVAALAPFESQL